MYKLISILFLSLNPLISHSIESYVYGKNQCYYFTPPTGWMADNQAGKKYNFPIVLYPSNSSWEKAKTIIYTGSFDKTKNEKTPADVVRISLKKFRTELRSPNTKAKKVGSIKSKSGVVAPIYKYTGDRNGNTEYVAYFDTKKTIDFFVMSSQYANDIEKNRPVFNSLGKSYRASNDCIPCKQKKLPCTKK